MKNNTNYKLFLGWSSSNININDSESINLIINSPLDQFDIKSLFGIRFFIMNINSLDITTFTIYILIISIVLYIYKIYPISQMGLLIGNRISLTQEMLYDTIYNMINEQIKEPKKKEYDDSNSNYKRTIIILNESEKSKNKGYYFPLIYTIFIFIIIANLISMIPYSYAITANIIFILSISIIIWLSVTILGLYLHGKKFFDLFLPNGCPLYLAPLLILIELLSYSARAISLGLRLSANTLSGHLLLIILASLLFNVMNISIYTFTLSIIPFIGILAIVILEFAIALIQAYVFSILTCGYLKDSLYLH